ncbi:sigma factor G inhibitor Gin [Thermosyntropha sp.]|uniref:sigma factor G inhibitor Gin n=1 Tax=Thermosyntropha sp. TaxID=2740820 RepID=UPI0025EBA9C8|nr:sigma factor G inhibitor Gin [Thermosyntropha sp.]MBO8159957.1 hypothetical protein [Thermosyntropha sp.]
MKQSLLICEESKGKVLPCCCFCGEVPEAGIMGGWMIRKFFICHKCEEAIVNMSIDSPDYERIMKKMRKILW